MVVQRESHAGAYSSVQYWDRLALRQHSAPTLTDEATVAEQIEHLASDYERAVFCREQAERYRRQWFAGSQKAISYVMARANAGDPRFKNMSDLALQITGRWRWSHSSQGQYLSKLETTFTGWAQLYLFFAEVEALSGRGKTRVSDR